MAQQEMQEEILWRQKSRQTWLKEGDKNTRFFHKATIQHRQQNIVSRLKTPSGQIVEKQADIESNLVHFYSELLKEPKEASNEDIQAITRYIPKPVTQDQNITLKRKIERMQVEEAIFQMEKGKAPGPDGFTIDFFQNYWDLVKEELWEVVEESRGTKRVLKAFNATFLSLIPKEQGADSPGKFQPISLCNMVLKIITKVMANCLKPIMSNLVSQEQSRFVEGRQILDGIILTQELIHSLKQTKQLGMMIKVDIEKAVNKVSWHFLKEILVAYRFQHDWVRWIGNLVSSTIFSIIVNEAPTVTFPTTRGLKQGDPLSTFLFIILAEGLGRALKAKR